MNTSIRSASAWAVLGPRNPSPAPLATQAFWTRARRTPPAAPWAKPCVVTTPSPLSYTQPPNNATTPLRWRYLASSLARTCDLLLSSLQLWVTPTPHWTCPSALRTPWRLAPTAPSPGWRPNSNTMAPTWLPFFARSISYTPIVWSAYGRPHPDTLTVLRSLSKSIARKRNIASAGSRFPTGCTRASHWRYGDAAHGKYAPAGLLRTSLPSWTWTPSSQRGLLPSTWLSGFVLLACLLPCSLARLGACLLPWLCLSWLSCAFVLAAPGGLPPWRPRGLALAFPVSPHLSQSLALLTSRPTLTANGDALPDAHGLTPPPAVAAAAVAQPADAAGAGRRARDKHRRRLRKAAKRSMWREI